MYHEHLDKGVYSYLFTSSEETEFSPWKVIHEMREKKKRGKREKKDDEKDKKYGKGGKKFKRNQNHFKVYYQCAWKTFSGQEDSKFQE